MAFIIKHSIDEILYCAGKTFSCLNVFAEIYFYTHADYVTFIISFYSMVFNVDENKIIC